LAKDPLLATIWQFYRGRGRRRRSPVVVALMLLGTLLLVAGVLVVIAAAIAGRTTVNLGDDPNTVPLGS
jgi:hypothetical protein